MAEVLEAPPAATWLPAVHTAPLSEDFPSAGDRLLQLVDLAWSSPESTTETWELDEWQRWLLRHVLEVYPDGHPRAGQLRYRQVVISMGRQNGKSVLAAILGLFGLLQHTRGPEVISVASTVEQARIVYDRVRHVVATNPTLARGFKPTGTRGIRSRVEARPGVYQVKAGGEESLQGVPISMALPDELHLWDPEPWDAIVLGTSARAGIIIGITTAGDDNSALLKRLYDTGRDAAAGEDGHDPRFGFFCWEAPEHAPVDDPAALAAANPAIACGRLDLDTEAQVVRRMPENQARRYRHNRFVSSEAAWLPMSLWHNAPNGTVPVGRPFVLAVSRARSWSAATITAAAKVDGHTHTEVVASLVQPNLDQLEDLVLDLWRRQRPQKVYMPAEELKDLALRLRERGVDVEFLTTAQMCSAAATAYAVISEGRLTHAGDPVVDTQHPRAVAKNSGDGWRISVKDSTGDVDAVVATVVGIYGADVLKPRGPMLSFA